MANIKFSEGIRDTMLNGTVSVETVFDSGVLEIRDGTQPVDANAVPSGTVLVTIALPASAFLAVANGVLAKDVAEWSAASAAATGVPTWFRLRTLGDDGSLSTTFARVDGDVTGTGSGGDMILVPNSVTAGDKVTADTFNITIPG